jgi:hypothetical protein
VAPRPRMGVGFRIQTLAVLNKLYPARIFMQANASYNFVKKRAFFLRRALLVICVVVLLALLAPVRRILYYNSFVQAPCVITAKSLLIIRESKSNESGNVYGSYRPQLSYTLTLPGGQQVSAKGFEGPDILVYSTKGAVQRILDRYHVGEKTNCWYDPANPQRALLVFQGFTFGQILSSFAFFFLAFLIFVPALAYCLEWQLWRYIVLRTRGVLTRGIVVNRVEQRRRDFTINVYTVLYRTGENQQEGVARHIQLMAPPIERHSLPDLYNIFVCYDPRQSMYDRCGKFPRLYRIIPGVVGSLFFLGLTLVFMYEALFNLYWV